MNAQAGHLQVVPGGLQRGIWEELWELDDWKRSELPQGDLTAAYRGEVTIKMSAIEPAWLKESTKRWMKSRILAGSSVRTLAAYANDLVNFSNWIRKHEIRLVSPMDLTREVIEDYMFVVRQSDVSTATKQRRVGTLRMLIDEQREDGLAGIARSAEIRGAEVPRLDYRLPKSLDDFVFDQVVDPKNLRRLGTVQRQTIVLLIARTGMRVSSVVTLPRDAMLLGSDGHPYLRYINVKMGRESVLPISPDLANQISLQLEDLEAGEQSETPYLLPSPRDPASHISPTAVFRTLKSYIIDAEIKHRDGSLATEVHPHLFRHYVGTSMVNSGVPLTVIQRVLDHQSIEMTAHYAQLQDETLRREVQQWHERVNIRGERISLAVEGPLAEAEWMKERISRARQALPNGYCGLPLVQTCPHPNACLSCDNFLTDASFAGVHVAQLDQTRDLIQQAQESDHQRQVEALKQDEMSLIRIIEGLETLEESTNGQLQLGLKGEK